MKTIRLTILFLIIGFTSNLAVAGDPFGNYEGKLNSNTYGAGKGTISNWLFLEDGTIEGEWTMDIGGGVTVSDLYAWGTYTYNGTTAVANVSGWATDSYYGEDDYYEMTLNLTFPSSGTYDSEGTYSIDFDTWFDDTGTWQTNLNKSPMANHVYYIDISNGLYYQDPCTDELLYEFDIELETDDTVVFVEFDTPQGYTFEIPDIEDNWDDVNQIWTNCEYDPNDDVWRWEFYRARANRDHLQDFGDDRYKVVVWYSGGGYNQTDIWFGTPYHDIYIPQPTQKPVLNYPGHHTSVTSPVTFNWQSCTDPNATGIWVGLEREETSEEKSQSFDLTKKSWGPISLTTGFWDAQIDFEQWYDISNNYDGIPYGVGKYSGVDYLYAVGRDWVAYEVWGGNTDYTGEPQWWEYYHNIDKYDYVKLGESSAKGGTFAGDYDFYVIAVRQEVYLDSIRGSDGQYLDSSSSLYTGNTTDWENYRGVPDGQYATVGYQASGGTFRGFVVIPNPGNWDSITVITDQDSGSVYRFWSPKNSCHFYTISEADKDYVLKTYPPSVWTYEGPAYCGFKWQLDNNLKPVYRFWSPVNSCHFFTISEDDKNFVIATWPHIWTYEGIAFYAYPVSQKPANEKPVYRFWSPKNSCHFYTISEDDKNYVLTTYPADIWTYEGPAWYTYE